MMKAFDNLINNLIKNDVLQENIIKEIIQTDIYDEELFKYADYIRKNIYGNSVYIRGLIEFTNYCKNNCNYCGIRCGNSNLSRYRLSKEQIIKCCDEGYKSGFRTFVLQGGEDNYFTDKIICDIVEAIRDKFPDCAITLSIGEKSKESYKAFYDAGANRYLLRHETADNNHYEKLHPSSMSLDNRKRCLYDLKDIGYQVGSGFMVGSPYQTLDNLVSDIKFLQELKPDMIGIGPYITHKDTPFNNFKCGSVKLTLRLLSLLRIIFPYALIPATTALGTLCENGRELGIKSGANVIMPNLTPVDERKKYQIYENKKCTGEESCEGLDSLSCSLKKIGYEIVVSRGDALTLS